MKLLIFLKELLRTLKLVLQTCLCALILVSKESQYKHRRGVYVCGTPVVQTMVGYELSPPPNMFLALLKRAREKNEFVCTLFCIVVQAHCSQSVPKFSPLIKLHKLRQEGRENAERLLYLFLEVFPIAEQWFELPEMTVGKLLSLLCTVH